MTSSHLRVTGFVLAVVVAALAAVVVWQVRSEGETAPVATDGAVVRADSHRLDDAGPDAPVLVEFLDLECEGCAAVHPLVEQVREQYAGRITVVARYFPMPGHANARNAAHAAEAAARQGRFEAMYARLFETQAAWGEKRESQADVFRSYAERLGLDMARYDRDVVDPEVAARVQADVDDGFALGVTGTPTFFLDGERLELTSAQDLYDALDASLAR